MMAYLTRRENFADGSPPPKKPYSSVQFKNKTDILLQGVYGTGKSSNAFLVDLMQKELNKAVEEGVVTMQEGLEFIKSRKKYYDTELGKQEGEKKKMPPSYSTERSELFTGSGDYAKKYLKYKDKPTQDKFNKLVNNLRTDLSLDSAISEALRIIREPNE
jgi:hypothetical protein